MSETLSVKTRCGLSGTALKYIACITMLIDHIGASCIEAGILRPALDAGTLSADALASAPLYQLDRVLRFTGRLAFPIFCFLLVEGFVHTHDVKKYLGRMVLFGLVSEIPYDLAFFRSPFDPSQQNVYWTLALGVLANTDYTALGVVIIGALYLTRRDRKRQCIVGAVLFAFELTAPLAFLLIWFYNGQRGKCGKALQKCFYGFYPVHIALLALITNCLL